MKHSDSSSQANTLLQQILLPLWQTDLFNLSKEDTESLNFSILQNAYLLSKLFNTEEKLKWLQSHQEKFREIVKESFFNKDQYIDENYEDLEKRLEECMCSG